MLIDIDWGDRHHGQLVRTVAGPDWTRSRGGQVARFNLAQEPLAVVEDELAHDFLLTAGEAGLQLTTVDGATVLTGRYPSRAELATWAGIHAHESAVQSDGSPRLLTMADPAGASSAGSGCCGGADLPAVAAAGEKRVGGNRARAGTRGRPSGRRAAAG